MGNITKVLMTSDTIGGVWAYSVALAKGLADYGIEIYLATMGRPLNSTQKKDIAGIRNLSVIESNYMLEWMEEPWEDIEKAGEWLLTLEKIVQPDIIHLNNYSFGSLPWENPVVTVCHSDVYSWFQQAKDQSPPKKYSDYREKVIAGLRGSDLVIGLSRTILNDIHRNFGRVRNERVIYYGISPEGYRKSKKENYIFGLGRNEEEANNLKVLGEIAERVKWPVRIAGEAVEPWSGEKINVNALQSNGHLSPEGIREQFSKASIFVLPSKYDPFGLSAIEAALSGCVLVLSDIPGLKEIWRNSAIYFDPSDPEDLKKKLDFCIENPGVREEMSQAAYTRAMQYSNRNMATRYYGFYSSLIEEGSKVEKSFQEV